MRKDLKPFSRKLIRFIKRTDKLPYLYWRIRTLGLIQRLLHIEFQRLDEEKKVIHWLAAKQGEKIIDIGCGDGYYDRLIAKSGAQVCAIDKNYWSIEYAKHINNSDNTFFSKGRAEDLPFPDKLFDKAVSFCVMEHIENDNLVFKEINRVLAPGGVLVLSLDSLSNRELCLEYRRQHKKRFKVKRFYNHKNIKPKLAKHGFRVEKTEYVYTTPISLGLVKLSYLISPRRWKHLRIYTLYFIGSIFLLLLGRPVSFLSEKLAKRASEGLTLIVKAKKIKNIP